VLSRSVNDAELSGLIIDTIFEDIPRQIDIWKDALFTGDADVVGRQTHAIKGEVGNICA
jgi:hypothetical protein